MNEKRFQKAFGDAPEAFTFKVSETLRILEEEKPVKKMSIRLAISLTLITVLLLGAAYAAVNQWDLQQFFTGLFGVELNEGAQNILGQKQDYGTLSMNEFDVTVNEAIADGKYLYIGALVTPKAGVQDLLFLGVDALPEERMNRFDSGEASKSYAEYAQETGKRMQRVSVYWQAGEWSNEALDYLGNDDGTLSYIVLGALPMEQDTVEVECMVITYLLTPEGDEVPDTRRRETFSITVPLTRPEESRQSSAKQQVEALGIQIDSVEWQRTAITTYSTVTFSVLDSATEAQQRLLRDGLMLRFVDEQGQRLPNGTSMVGVLESPDDIHYTATESLSLSALPDRVFIQFFNYMDKTVYDTVEVALSE